MESVSENLIEDKIDDINVVTVDYEQFDVINGNVNHKLKDKLDELLMIYNAGNIIYICHPVEIFQYLVTDKSTKQPIYVDWDSIDAIKMFNSKSYERISMSEQMFSSGLINRRYIDKKGFEMMRKYLGEGYPEYVYPFVIVEEVENRRGPNQYVVRGIICKNQDGYQIAFNPQFVIEAKKGISGLGRAIRMGSYYGF